MANSWLQVGKDHILNQPRFVDPLIHTAYYLHSYASDPEKKPWEWGKNGEGQDMLNFKKDISNLDTTQRSYKNSAAKKFAEELKGFLRSQFNSPPIKCITHMPGSKNPDDKHYDNYLEKVVQYSARNLDYILPENIFYQVTNRGAMHSGDFDRKPDKLKDGWALYEGNMLNDYSEIIIVDDMITAGTSICASYEFLNENIPDCPKITHIAWMRKLWDSPADDFSDEFEL